MGMSECDGQVTTTEPCLVRCCCRSSCKCSVYVREPRSHTWYKISPSWQEHYQEYQLKTASNTTFPVKQFCQYFNSLVT